MMNLMLSDLLWVFLVVLVGLFWWHAAKSHERAFKVVLHRCKELDVQVLDQNVALLRLGIGRNPRGRLGFTRTYSFEFSSTGDERYLGVITMMGRQVIDFELSPHRLN